LSDVQRRSAIERSTAKLTSAPLAVSHSTICRCPRLAAYHNAITCQGQPCSRAHCSAARSPHLAMRPHVRATHGHPFCFAQASRPADRTKSASLSFTRTVRPAHARWAGSLTASRPVRLTRASTARVVGSIRGSTSASNRTPHSSIRGPSSGEPRCRAQVISSSSNQLEKPHPPAHIRGRPSAPSKSNMRATVGDFPQVLGVAPRAPPQPALPSAMAAEGWEDNALSASLGRSRPTTHRRKRGFQRFNLFAPPYQGLLSRRCLPPRGAARP
jgi:hypothetical protein